MTNSLVGNSGSVQIKSVGASNYSSRECLVCKWACG